MERRNLIVQKIIAILIIFVMSVAECAILGITTVSYAIDMLATNSDNVEFKAYFKEQNPGTGAEEELTKIERSINKEDVTLLIDVAVMKEGYFSGQISLENAGFKLREEANSSYISKIENNIIYLNQINAEEVAKLEVGIKFLEDSEIEVSRLNNPTKVKLTGTYYNSQRNMEIEGESEVTVSWKVPEGTKVELAEKLLTNSTYQVAEGNKKVVQVLVTNKLTNNAYPIKNTKIQMNVPEGAQVEVHKRTTIATNGNKDFNQVNYKVENNILEIEVGNEEEEGKISWIRTGQDIYVVTYEFDENKEIANMPIKVRGSIETYSNDIYMSEEQQINLVENIDGIVTVSKNEKEAEIYKGKLYTGEEREYTSYTRAYIDYAKAIEKIEIEEKEVKYISTEEKEANIEYKEIRVNKQNIAKVLGNIWSIKVKDQNNNINIITSEMQEDEDGNIKITLGNGVKSLKIETNKPINNGIIEIETTKKMLKTEYTREEIKALTEISNNVDIIYTKNNQEIKRVTAQYNIALKETQSKASINLNTERLQTLTTNENVELVAKLNTNDESMNLYKNPTIEIVFPREIEDIKVRQSSRPLYTNGLEVEENKVYKKEDGRLALWIKLKGEQSQYDANGGLEAHLYLDIEVNDLVPTKKSNIEMNYTNEFDSTTGRVEMPFLLESQYGLLMYSKVSNYNSNNDILRLIQEKEETIKLDTKGESRDVILNTALINNYGEKITNVNIIGSIPVKNDINTFNATLKSITASNAKIYYSKNINAKIQDSSWTENIEGAVAYKITISEMQPSEIVQIERKITIPENLGYNQEGYIKDYASYLNGNNLLNKTQSLLLKTDERITTMMRATPQTLRTANGLETKIVATSGNTELEEGNEIHQGQTIKYNITITNQTETDYSNVNVNAVQTNGKVWKLMETEVFNPHTLENSMENFYKTSDSNEINLAQIETLRSGQSITLEYEAIADLLENNQPKVTYGTINITSQGGELDNSIKTIENTITSGKLSLKVLETDSRENYWLAGGTITSSINIKNLIEQTLNNVELKIILSKELYCREKEENNAQENSNDELANGDPTPDNPEDSEEVEDDEDYEEEGDIPGDETEENENDLINSIDLGDYADRITFENLEKNNEGETIITLKIANIEANEEIKIHAFPYVADFNGAETNVRMIAQAKTESENTYYSNNLIRTAYQSAKDIYLMQKAYLNGNEISNNTEIKNGEKIQFVVNIKNNEQSRAKIAIQDRLPNGVKMDRVIVTRNNADIDKTQDVEDNMITLEYELEGNEEIILKIDAIVDTSIIPEKTFTNEIEISDLDTAKSYTSNLKINTNKTFEDDIEEEPEEEPIEDPEEKSDKDETNEEQDNPDDGYPEEPSEEPVDDSDDEPTEDNPQEDPEEDTQEDTGEDTEEEIDSEDGENYTIKGIVWVDKNRDGKRDANEPTQEDIEVGAINTENGNTFVETANTNSEGVYSLRLPKGKYILAFLYDNDEYLVTTYKLNGVDESLNSDAVTRNITIDDEEIIAATTDEINLKSDISNIDLGLIEKDRFDLKLQKYVSRVVVTNKGGTKTMQFDKDTSIPKVDIRGKYLSGSVVLVEYTIRVTNIGDIGGYAREIVDKIPSGLKYQSSLNQDWYENGDSLYNESIADEVIEPGEAKEVKIILTKTMTASNTGLFKNSANISNLESENGAIDSNLNDNESSADIIITVSTGEAVSFVTITLLITVLISICGYFVVRQAIRKYE